MATGVIILGRRGQHRRGQRPGVPRRVGGERRADRRGIVIDRVHADALERLADRFELSHELEPWSRA